ncbi:MAG: GntR family transcriptional regulator [Devosia sp.]|nr:GntR family transcriptional regulator [Devosia sp.]
MNKEHFAKGGARAQATHRALKNAILDQVLLPGSKLPEDSIGERLGVSRTLVREALVRLSEEGLVEMVPNKGAVVAQPTVEEARHNHITRVALERLVVESLDSQLTPEQERTLLDHIAAEEAAAGKRGAVSVRLSGDFHTLLASMTNNETLIRYVNEVVGRSSFISSMYARPHESDCGVVEHRQILAAIKAGDSKKAVALMTEHLDAMSNRALLPKDESTDLRDVLNRYVAAEELRS